MIDVCADWSFPTEPSLAVAHPFGIQFPTYLVDSNSGPSRFPSMKRQKKDRNFLKAALTSCLRVNTAPGKTVVLKGNECHAYNLLATVLFTDVPTR